MEKMLEDRIVVVDVKFRWFERKRRVDVCQCEQRRTSGVRGIQVCPDRTCDDSLPVIMLPSIVALWLNRKLNQNLNGHIPLLKKRM
jgi:hypothetical protein